MMFNKISLQKTHIFRLNKIVKKVGGGASTYLEGHQQLNQGYWSTSEPD